MPRPWARFDDLTVGKALLCPPPRRVLTAVRPDDVAGVLQEVHDATEGGSWAFGYVAYEAAAGLDPQLPGGSSSPGEPPLVWFGLCDEPARVEVLEPPTEAVPRAMRWRPDWTDDEYARAVARVREHIAAGETYQCNLTDRLRSTLAGDPEDLYAHLALAQRGAYNAYLDLGRHVVASASPELFFEWTGDVVRTRPMKGTAQRGRTTTEDHEQSRILRSSSKEQAENLMIVDLLRNDLSRVAEIGSVIVDELFSLERYPTVWQMTSQVSARVRAGTGLLELFRALFPCGSVTGAPKRRTMQLIDDIEPTPRGVYCGAVGLVAPPAAPFRARFNVAIRTVVVDRSTGEAVYGVGGGITWGSEAALERAELHAKAAVLDHDVTEHRLLETLAFLPGEGLRNVDRHLARMADSADWTGFRFDRSAVLDAVTKAVSGRLDPARIRILVSRDGHVDVESQAMPPLGARPVRLALDDDPVDAASPWLQHKTTRRDVYLTRALRQPEADDVVLVNQQGELTETTTANLALRIGSRWWTPPTTSGCLPGVERARRLELGRLHERVLSVLDLQHAEQIAVLSSLRGWREARLVVGRRPAARGWTAQGDRGALTRGRRVSGKAQGREELDSQSIGGFLGHLAARMAAPGAGATAAVEAALSASLVAMVGRFTTDEEHADSVSEIVAAADTRRDACLAAAADDEAAFSAVAEAMKMPSDTADEKEARRRRLSQVQLDATRPPLAVLESAAELVELAGRLLSIANRNLISDVTAATTAARAVATTARLAVEANLDGIEDEVVRARLASAVAVVEDLARRADEIETEVRKVMHG